MGHGSYSSAAHAALLADRANASHDEVFAQRNCHPLMSPLGLTVRESRDSDDHPNSLAIVFALDVTGSMGDIPHQLATATLPQFMSLLTACKVEDPQLMFMAIGDANSDHAALQVGQFESTAELMDQWLTWTYIEGGGGGTGEESYELAFYVAAEHTEADCWAKRGKKGYLFLTGDEHPYPVVSRNHVTGLLGSRLDQDVPIEEVIAAAAENYHLFFLIPDLQRRRRCQARWRELLGDHVICMEQPEDTSAVAAAIVALTERKLANTNDLAQALAGQGMPQDRVSAVIRAVTPYVDIIDPSAVQRYHAAAPAEAAPASWWKRLFG